MSFLAALLDPIERRFSRGDSAHPSQPGAWIDGASAASFAGVAVAESNALQFTAVYCAVRILAESVAQLPIKLYRRLPDGGKEEAAGEPEYRLLHDAPNHETSSFIFRETGQAHLGTWGNFYAEIEMGARGQTVGLWQRRPDRVEVERSPAGALRYRFQRDGGGEDVLDSSQVLHIPGLGFNGLVGFSPVRMAREAIGLGLSLERYGASLFGNGTVPGLVIERPEALTPEGVERLRSQIERVHKGPERAGKVMVLDEGMTAKQIGLPSDDAEFLATRTFQVQEIARIYNLPPHLLKDLSKSSFSNIEEQGLDFIRVSLLPWLKRWEGELNRKVLTTRQQKAGFFFEFNVDGFLKGNFETRMKGHQTAVMGGWVTPNQVRKIENLNPDPALDYYLVPLNMAMLMPDGTVKVLSAPAPAGGDEPPADDAPPVRALPAPPEPEPRAAADDLRAAFTPLLEHAAQRVVNAEVQGIRRRLKSEGAIDLEMWLAGEFYPKHRDFLRSVLGPTVQAYMRALAPSTGADAYARLEPSLTAILTRNRHAIETLLADTDASEATAAVEEWLAAWEKRGARAIAESKAEHAAAALETP